MADDVADWLTKARAGSPEALGRALEGSRRYLLAIAGRKLAPELQAKDGASDLVQQTFLEAHRDFVRFEGTSEAELLAWLRHMLLHNVGKLHRRYRADKRNAGRETALADGRSAGVTEPACIQSTPSSFAAAKEEAVFLEQALSRLPQEYRQVIELRHREQLSFEETGARLGRSTNAGRMLWVRAIVRLREELTGER